MGRSTGRIGMVANLGETNGGDSTGRSTDWTNLSGPLVGGFLTLLGGYGSADMVAELTGRSLGWVAWLNSNKVGAIAWGRI